MRPPDDVAGTRTTSAPPEDTPSRVIVRLGTRYPAQQKLDDE